MGSTVANLRFKRLPLPRKHVLLASVLVAFAMGCSAESQGTGPDEVEEPKQPGFELIFDGNTLDHWDGDPVYWRVEDGAMVGEITPDKILKRNSFIIWRGGEVEDFELKLQYRITSQGNSGIGYRCVEMDGERWLLQGAQADLEGGDNWSGIHYEERARTILALRGQKVVIDPGARPRVVELFAPTEELQRKIRKDDWNDYHVLARGGRMVHTINGQIMSEVFDHDSTLGRRRGLLGVQVHVGPPMKVEYRNIELKRLPPEPSSTAGSVSAPTGRPALEFTNPIQMADLQRQAKTLMGPPPKEPIQGKEELTLHSQVRYVRSDLIEGQEPDAEAAAQARDLVLIDGDVVVRIPSVPDQIRKLSRGETYRFLLRWQQDEQAYRVLQTSLGDETVYSSSH